MSETKAGIAAMIGACMIWGLSPLYYKLVAEVDPVEVLAHRTWWSLVFFAGVLAVRGRLGGVARALRTPRSAGLLVISAVMISANWFLFILSIQIEHATEASLGYYIFPLMAVLLGVVAYGERLDRAAAVAVTLATLAVALLAIREGRLPWVSLIIASTFALYGLVKKRVREDGMTSVTTEVLILSPLALGWLAAVHFGPVEGGVFGNDLRLSLLLAASGPLTALPLILFSHASQRVPLGTIGLIQYLNPTLQFLCATLVFREPFGPVQAVTFALIWTALAIFGGARFAQDRRRRRAVSSSATVPHT
ncbi:protein RarD [Roseivivax marinus]|uniref:Protein RarD n=1 Tax=Roseivivax marinus TaxID=1379903 RepID=W4HPR0_9RHOB|nr:EamA family transporter RarD [Roseivivax marinus]ETW14388.1 protein RarD [Roseivivax marinus]UMA66379.1 EamA family transporter RarD [Roseivivax marinus]